MIEYTTLSADYGLLLVNVFLSNIGYPAENVAVTISDSESGETLRELTTNREGQLPPVRLPAPPSDYALDSTAPRPFSQVDIRAVLPGYDPAVIRNVQIFSDTAAIQNISLVPLYENVFIPYPTLWGDFPPKIPESELKRLPFPTNLSVLPEPVIPEFISRILRLMTISLFWKKLITAVESASRKIIHAASPGLVQTMTATANKI